MRSVKPQFIVIMALSIVFSFFVAQCSGEAQKQPTEQTTTQDEKEAVYYCPMECEGDKTYDKPGQCPECGMDLKKKSGDDQ